MLWVKSFHIIFVVTWFAGLFYLPRLFVYHSECRDDISNQRFKVMERKLYYAITTPSAILATLLGISLIGFNSSFYMQAGWMHAKLSLVVLLWVYHIYCYFLLKGFKQDNNQHSNKFYRWFNEIPALMLIAIVILVVVQPH